MDTVTRILGIDPGTRHVGYGVVECRGTTLVRVASGCVSGGNGVLAQRLVAIRRGLAEVIDAHRPQAAAVETVFTGVNPRTAIAIGEGRGVAVLAAAEKGLEVAGYEPALVKRAVAGSGRAGKEQVRSMVTVLLRLPEAPETDHEADALALAIAHVRHTVVVAGVGVLGGGRRKSLPRRSLPEAVLRQLPPGFLPR